MARLDAVMVQQGMVPSRQRAKTLIQNGQISVNGKVCTKPAFAVSETASGAGGYWPLAPVCFCNTSQSGKKWYGFAPSV